MQVKNVMTTDVKYVEVPGSRAETLELLRELGVSAVPVVKQGTRELVGMVTLRSLFDHPDEEQLAMLVDREVPAISPDDDLKEAARRLLEAGARRLPVLSNGKLVGIVTVKDIVYRAIATTNIEKPASDYMHKHIMAVWEGTPLRAAMEIMSLSGSKALPVIDEKGTLVGIVDDADIVKMCEIETKSTMSQMAGRSEGDSWTWDSEDRIYITKKTLKIPDKLVCDAMTRELVTITRRTSVSRCAELMKQHRIEQTPVVSAEKEFVGLVRDIDLLGALID